MAKPLSSRRKGGVLIDLASCGVQRDDADQVIGHVREAMELARATRSGYLARKIAAFAGTLGPLLSDSRVAALNAEIADMSAVE
ncbi:tetratricopeptide repeat protein [Streptomyces sp. RFCAC02]|uniref:tetratricopeptide repeat protein n=1 Tax=Streptomyces sp. RFCAC02 TaxID=2499143 RepID=UPI0010217533|nr:tetratricopeptide repeat protein [Streptomyces sp. RFCAC02]